jgi:hypothetical protein
MLAVKRRAVVGGERASRSEGMSLIGEGVVAIWNDIRPEARADFYEWHDREHMPERVAIPGFRRGRRYAAVAARPEFLTLYETDSVATLSGPDYLARLDDPTPWTRRSVMAFLNTSRSLCRVERSFGTGQGGLIVTWRFDVVEGREDEQRRLLVERALPALADRPGVVGAHLCLADRAASGILTAEKRLREERALVPTWIVLLEGGSEASALEAAWQEVLPDAALVGAGARPPIERGLYQLQYSRGKDPAG